MADWTGPVPFFFPGNALFGEREREREREMGCSSSPPYNKSIPILLAQTPMNHNCHNFQSTSSFPSPNGTPLNLKKKKNPLTSSISFPTSSPFTAKCRDRIGDDEILSTSSAYDVLGVIPNCSPAQLKAVFRAKVCTLNTLPSQINSRFVYPFFFIQFWLFFR